MSLEAADETVFDRLGRLPFPFDLLAVVGYVALAVVFLFRPGVYGTPLAVALGIPLLFFLPGYALVAMLFPGATPDDADGKLTVAPMGQHGLSGPERVALGFGISVALLPVIGIALAASPWSIGPWPVLVSVSGLTVCFAVVGAFRRSRRPPDRRFSVPLRTWFDAGRRVAFGGSVAESILNVGLAAAVVLSVAAIGYAVATPGASQPYTSVSLLSQNETGQLVAAGYPRTFESGESKPLVVALENHEGERTRYSVVVELQRVRQADDGTAKVVQDRHLATFNPTVEAGATWRTTHEVTPTMTGENLRLVYLVYEGEPPENPTTSNAYRRVHVWVNVTG